MEDWDSPRMRLLTPTQRNIYVSICGHLGRYSGECWPRQRTIAAMLHVTDRAVRKGVNKLKELGYLKVERVARGRKRINVYTVLSPPRTTPADTPVQP